jgi:hypothetical protein
MKSNNPILAILKLLEEAKTEAFKHEYRTLGYFIDMAVLQAHDEATNPNIHSVKSLGIDKKQC